MYDLILKGGRIYDGSGLPSFIGDVAIRSGRIEEIGKDQRFRKSRSPTICARHTTGKRELSTQTTPNSTAETGRCQPLDTLLF